MKEKREQILKQIGDEENEKQKIQQELAALTQRLSRINESLARKVCTALDSTSATPYTVVLSWIVIRLSELTNMLHPCCSHCLMQIDTKTEYDKVILETEAAYLKILESSQTLLTVLKRESVNIQKKRQAAT